MYSTIKNPRTGRLVSVHGALGRNIIKQYRLQVGGHTGPCAKNSRGRCAKSKKSDGKCQVSPKGVCVNISKKTNLKQTKKKTTHQLTAVEGQHLANIARLAAQHKKKIADRKQLQKKKPKVAQRHYKNPYAEVYPNVAQAIDNLIRTTTLQRTARAPAAMRSRPINITGNLLRALRFKVRDTSMNIEIPWFSSPTHNIIKLKEYVSILSEMYKRLASETINRKDYFTNPSPDTARRLALRSNIRKDFINFVFSFIGGGGPGVIQYSPDTYIEDYVAALAIGAAMPAVPDSAPAAQVETAPARTKAY